jgi:hypothetical protein
VNKRKTLTVQQLGFRGNPKEYDYRIIQVTNAVQPRVGDVLPESEIEVYCRDIDWTVNVKGTRR